MPNLYYGYHFTWELLVSLILRGIKNDTVLVTHKYYFSQYHQSGNTLGLDNNKSVFQGSALTTDLVITDIIHVSTLLLSEDEDIPKND